MALSYSLPLALARHYPHSDLLFRAPHPFAPSTLNANISLSSSTNSKMVTINCAFRKLSDCSCWETFSEEKKIGFSLVFEEARMEALNFRKAQRKVEEEVRIAKRETILKEQELVRLKKASKLKLQSLEKSLGPKLLYVMKKRTRLMVGKEILAFTTLIGEIRLNCSLREEYSLPFQERWIIICSRYPFFFEKMKSCNESWATEADIADVVYNMRNQTMGFVHYFKEVDDLIYMDLPEEVATEDLRRLASVIAEEAGFALGFYAAVEMDKPDRWDPYVASD